MDIRGKKILILGGWGLVGLAMLRRLVEYKPSEIVILSLKEEEAKEACRIMEGEEPDVKYTPAWGNIFVRESFKDLSRGEIMNNAENRQQIIRDVMEGMEGDTLQESWLFKLIAKHQPNVLIDSVNSATGLAYQDVYTGYFNLKNEMADAKVQAALTDDFVVEVEKLVASLYVPQIIRHIQILHAAMQEFKTGIYLKIGTTGTGGMGLNIPYTHSEEKPSRVLLSKTSLAGAHTMLLFLMGRTPDGPICKEIKPAAAIAWKGIKYGEVRKAGQAIPLYDCPTDKGMKLGSEYDFRGHKEWQSLDDTLHSVFIDTGENGIFSRGEFETITTAGQMEFVTPEEIAHNVIMEIQGANTGRDIINALDNAVMGPTYRAGYLRHYAIDEMKRLEEEKQVESTAFEMLGPPRLSKLLFEAKLIKNCYGSIQSVKDVSAEDMVEKLSTELKNNSKLRSEIISVGIPVLMPNGKNLLRGPMVKIPVQLGGDVIPMDGRSKELWADAGWVDLRRSNMQEWLDRFEQISSYVKGIDPSETSSRYHHGLQYWRLDEKLNIGKVAAWIFIHEEKGARIK